MIRIALAASAGIAVAIVTFLLLHRASSRHGSESARPPIDTRAIPAPFATGPQLAPWIAAAREARDPLARMRTVLDRITSTLQSSGARVVTEAEDVPRARPLDAIAAALASRGARMTTLDLARMEAGVLRAAGVDATVVEQTRSLRPDEPADPSGLLGRYAVTVGEHAADVGAGAIAPAREIGPHAMDEHAIAGAMLAQTALADALDGRNPSGAVSLADQAVQQWPDSAVPLATRARVNQVLGGPGAAAMARQDLDAALAMRDSAPVRLLRARDALLAGSPETTLAEVRHAVRLAPHWGEAALAFAILAPHAPDAGDRCAPLASARDDWATDALQICREGPSPDPSRVAVAQRWSDASRDPIRLAFAASAGATGATSRVLASDRTELAAWLVLVGRPDLAQRALGVADAGP